jgi:hypothetical protein
MHCRILTLSMLCNKCKRALLIRCARILRILRRSLMRIGIGCCLAIVPCMHRRTHPPPIKLVPAWSQRATSWLGIRTVVNSHMFDAVDEVVAGGLRCLQTAPPATSRLSRVIDANLMRLKHRRRAAWRGRHVIPRSINMVVHAMKLGLKAAVCEYVTFLPLLHLKQPFDSNNGSAINGNCKFSMQHHRNDLRHG